MYGEKKPKNYFFLMFEFKKQTNWESSSDFIVNKIQSISRSAFKNKTKNLGHANFVIA